MFAHIKAGLSCEFSYSNSLQCGANPFIKFSHVSISSPLRIYTVSGQNENRFMLSDNRSQPPTHSHFRPHAQKTLMTWVRNRLSNIP